MENDIKIRNSSIELLRIIAILFIITGHYSVHNGFDNRTITFGVNRVILDISKLGSIGVIIFIVISGYYMIDRKISTTKVLLLWLQTFFYSVGIYVVLIVLGLQKFSIVNLIKAMFPIIFSEYWFIGVYIIMYVLSPFINSFLNSLDKHKHCKFNFIMLVIFSVLPTFTANMFYGNELIQFLLFYSLGAYMAKYKKLYDKEHSGAYIILLISAVLLVLSVVVFDLFGTKIQKFNTVSTYFFNRNSILAIVFSVALFGVFIRRKKFCNSVINLISSCTLGVYLIHDNHYLRSVLWENILRNKDYVNSDWMIVHLIVSVLSVFAVCTIIEIIRKFTVEKLTRFILSDRVENLCKKVKSYIKIKS